MDIKLSYEELQNIASGLKTSSETMAQILNEVKNEFSNIGDDNTWSGTAASETKATFDTLSAKFPEFSQAVESCYTYLTQTVIPNYQAVDSAITGQN